MIPKFHLPRIFRCKISFAKNISVLTPVIELGCIPILIESRLILNEPHSIFVVVLLTKPVSLLSTANNGIEIHKPVLTKNRDDGQRACSDNSKRNVPEDLLLRRSGRLPTRFHVQRLIISYFFMNNIRVTIVIPKQKMFARKGLNVCATET